jgi:phosphonate transport system substrate-binding protein
LPALLLAFTPWAHALVFAVGSTDEGRKKFEPTKYSGFERYDQAELLAIGKWLGL